MQIITIRGPSSYDNLDEVKKHLMRLETMLSTKLRLVKVTMDYNVEKGLPPYDCDSKDYPFKATFETSTGETVEIRIFCLTVGYGGGGPTCTEEILQYLQVPYEPDDIFTKRRMAPGGHIHLEYNM